MRFATSSERKKESFVFDRQNRFYDRRNVEIIVLTKMRHNCPKFHNHAVIRFIATERCCNSENYPLCISVSRLSAMLFYRVYYRTVIYSKRGVFRRHGQIEFFRRSVNTVLRNGIPSLTHAEMCRRLNKFPGSPVSINLHQKEKHETRERHKQVTTILIYSS